MGDQPYIFLIETPQDKPKRGKFEENSSTCKFYFRGMKSRKKFIYCYLRFFFGNCYFFNEMLQDDEQDDDAIGANDDS